MEPLQRELEQLRSQQLALERERAEADAARDSPAALAEEMAEIRRRCQRDTGRALRAYFRAVGDFPRYRANRERQLRGARGFSFESRELQKPQRIRTRRMREEAQAREQELQRVLRHRFRASPVPPSTYMNKYDLMLEEWRQRKAAVEALAVEKAQRMRDEAAFIRASAGALRPAREVMCVRQRAESTGPVDRRSVVELRDAPIEVKLHLWPALEEHEQVRKERIKQRAVERLHETNVEEARRAVAVTTAMRTQPSVDFGAIPTLTVPIVGPIAHLPASSVPGTMPPPGSTVSGTMPPPGSAVSGTMPPPGSAVSGTMPPPGSTVLGTMPPPGSTVLGTMPPPASTVPGTTPPPSSTVSGTMPPPGSAVSGTIPPPASIVPGTISPPGPTVPGTMPPPSSTVPGTMPPRVSTVQTSFSAPGNVPPPPCAGAGAVLTASPVIEKPAEKINLATQSGDTKKRKKDDMATLRKHNPNLSFKPKIRAGVPNFDALWTQERLALAKRKRTKVPTETKPFNLTASAKDGIVYGRRPSPQSRNISAQRRCKSVDRPTSGDESHRVRTPIPKGTRAHAIRTRAVYNKYINVGEEKEREENDEALFLQEAHRRQRVVNARLKEYLKDARANNDAVIREKVKALHQHNRELELEAADRLKQMRERVAQIPPIFVEPTHLQGAAKERAQAEMEVLQMLTESGVDSNTISAILRASGNENSGGEDPEVEVTKDKEDETAKEDKTEVLSAPKEEKEEKNSDPVISSSSTSSSTVDDKPVAEKSKEKGAYDDDFEESSSSSVTSV